MWDRYENVSLSGLNVSKYAFTLLVDTITFLIVCKYDVLHRDFGSSDILFDENHETKIFGFYGLYDSEV